MKEELRSGYTTGTSASAATYIALSLLLDNKTNNSIDIIALDGTPLKIPVHSYKLRDEWARGVVLKDAGDDPDVTNGIEICAKVKIVDKFPNISKAHIHENVMIVGGRGVGVVTKKGLKIIPGKSAINPEPQKMILNSINHFKNHKKLINKKIVVYIYVPKGLEKAKKTLNAKLGILNGISILGTTGIVKPMSEDALTKSMFEELKVLKSNTARDWAIFAFGNHGKRFCQENNLDLDHLIITSNYIGFMIDSAVKLGVKRILLIGHIGKAIKVAGGIFNTHSRVADGRLEILAANAIILDEPRENILKILKSNTAEEACNYVENQEIFNLIADKVSTKSFEYSREEIRFESILFNYKGDILGVSKDFYNLLEELKNE